MSYDGELAAIFERDRPRLRRVAHRILGDWDQAEEGVQECWLKADGIPQDEIRNAGAWLTTIITRICLDRLRHRRRTAFHSVAINDPAHESAAANVVGDEGPEYAALMSDAVGVALLVVLERLNPLERVAFVLHDVFAVPFQEIAGMIDRSPQAARQLASRARRRVRGPAVSDGKTMALHRKLAEAFLMAAREGDMGALLKILDPDVVLDADQEAASIGSGPTLTGADEVARFFSGRAAAAHAALIDGAVGIIVAPAERLLLAVLLRFTNGRIAHLRAIAAPSRLGQLNIGLPAATENGRLARRTARRFRTT
jgi:RNA polymerase sigma factor (sigma-70 family)